MASYPEVKERMSSDDVAFLNAEVDGPITGVCG